MCLLFDLTLSDPDQMPFLLRTLRKNKFDEEQQFEWVPDGDIQADALNDLRTSGNCLSVWLVEDSEETLLRLLAAIAAGRDHLSNIDYALIAVSEIQKAGLELVENDGQILDDAMKALHRDVVKISAFSLGKLAVAIQEKAELERLSRGRVKSIIRESIDAGYIQRSDIKFTI